MFTPIAALWDRGLTLTGSGSLLSRPVSMMEKPLRELGVEISTVNGNGFPPLWVKGPLKGGETTVDGSISSQFLTGLSMALPKAPGNSRIHVINLKSKPYIDMTLALLKDFGVDVEYTGDYETFRIRGGQTYCAQKGEYRVEGDWSGASFLSVAGAIGGSITITGLDIASKQGDRRIIDALEMAGADVKQTDDTVTITKKKLNGFQFDATHCPDLFPPLAVLACNCAGVSVIQGVERLTFKESNRAVAIREALTSLGAEIHIEGNRMEIKGTRLNGGIIDPHNDHRIAMAAAVAAVNALGDITILDPLCVDKSYPDFFNDLHCVGGVII
jgi:3-phosphoshikimate 1-carboxyvinyltransferase